MLDPVPQPSVSTPTSFIIATIASENGKYWSGLPFLPPEGLPGIQLKSPASPGWVGRFFTTEPPGKPLTF